VGASAAAVGECLAGRVVGGVTVSGKGGRGAGRPNSQPWPRRAPIITASWAWSSVSMPSASTRAPLRSACALTAVMMSATSMLVLAWTRRRSSLMTSGCSNGSNARLAGSAPTSSSATRQPRARTPAAARRSPAGSAVRSRSVISMMIERSAAARRIAVASAGGGALTAGGSTLMNNSRVAGSRAVRAPRNAANRHAQSSSTSTPWSRAAANRASGVCRGLSRGPRASASYPTTRRVSRSTTG